MIYSSFLFRSQEGEPDLAAKMQDLALAEAALPRHLLDALYASGSESRLFALRELSRQLVGLWLTGHPATMNALKRIMVSTAYLGATPYFTLHHSRRQTMLLCSI